MVKQLRQIHSTQFPHVFSIGWDIVSEDETQNVYALEGNISHSSWFYPERIDANIISEYKSKLSRFLESPKTRKKPEKSAIQLMLPD